MNGHEKRKQKKISEIKKTTFALCNQYGSERISVDEIADKSNVSKATIYKYFGSKEELIEDVIADIYNGSIYEFEQIVAEDNDFLDKLYKVIRTKLDSFNVMQGDFIKELFTDFSNPKYQEFDLRVRELMHLFYEQGKEQGYIDKELDTENLYMFSQVFTFGFQSLVTLAPDKLTNRDFIEQMIDLYFNGFITRKK